MSNEEIRPFSNGIAGKKPDRRRIQDSSVFKKRLSDGFVGLMLFCTTLILAPLTAAAQTDTSWIVAGPGNWNTPSNWSGSFVPNNGWVNWNVFINNGNVVDFDTSASINQLNLDAGNGLNILNGFTLTIDNNGDTGSGIINNDGTVSLVGTGASTFLNFTGTSAINGSGTIHLAGGNNTAISGFGTLTNGAGHTIQGSGNVGNNGLSIINLGTIQAGSGDVMTIDPSNLGSGVPSFVNDGLVRAFSGGQILLTGSNFGEFSGAGTYRAEAGSQIDLVTSFIGRNMTFSTLGDGQIRVTTFNTATWDNVTNAGNTVVGIGANLVIEDNLINQGDLLISGSGQSSFLSTSGTSTLTGGGTIRLDGGDFTRLQGSGTFINVDNTISGNGNIGGNAIAFTNQGTIQAGAGETLVIDPVDGGAGVATFNNNGSGIVRATNGGNVTLTGSNFGEFSGTGTFEALDDGNLIFDASAIVQNVSANILNSGTWRAIDSGSGANVRIQNDATDLINTIGANAAVELSGVNSNFTVRSMDFSLDSTLNNLEGQLVLRNSRDMNLSGGLSHSGSLIVDSSTMTLAGDFSQNAGNTMLIGGGTLDLSAGLNNVLSGGTLGGNGTVIGNLENFSGMLAPGLSPGQLEITGNYVQTSLGVLEIEIGGTNQGVDFDYLLVGGLADLNGSLLVSLFGDFVPEATDTFEILSANSLSGEFSNASFQVAIQGGGFFDVTYTGTSVILGNFNPVPEPSSLLLVGVLGTTMLARRKRRN